MKTEQVKTTTEWGEMDKVRQADHDMLIRLETVVTTIASDVKEVKHGTINQLTELGIRLGVIERKFDQYDLKIIADNTEANKQWIHDFQVRYKIIVILAGFVGSVLGTIITLLSLGLQIFRK